MIFTPAIGSVSKLATGLAMLATVVFGGVAPASTQPSAASGVWPAFSTQVTDASSGSDFALGVPRYTGVRRSELHASAASTDIGVPGSHVVSGFTASAATDGDLSAMQDAVSNALREVELAHLILAGATRGDAAAAEYVGMLQRILRAVERQQPLDPTQLALSLAAARLRWSEQTLSFELWWAVNHVEGRNTVIPMRLVVERSEEPIELPDLDARIFARDFLS